VVGLRGDHGDAVLRVQLADKTGGGAAGNAVAEYGDVHGGTVW